MTTSPMFEPQVARILVVDDDHGRRGMVVRRLVLAGFEVVETDSGAGAVDAAEACLPNLIVLDPAIPGRGGLSVAEQLRADPQTARIPVLALTAPVDLEGLLRGARALLRMRLTPIDPNTGFGLDRSFRW